MGHYDVIIVGGSFAGLSAAMQLVRAHRSVLVIDSGKPRNRFTYYSHGVLGHDGYKPDDIFSNVQQQLTNYPTVKLLKDTVIKARKEPSGFSITTMSNSNFTSRKLILATGLQDNLPPIPELPERWGKSVSHCPYYHGYEASKQPLGVLATCPDSIEQAILLSDWSSDITFFLNNMKLSPENEEQLIKRNIKLETEPILSLEGEDFKLQYVYLANHKRVSCSILFIVPKLTMAAPLAEQLGCNFKQELSISFIKTDKNKETNISGVYAIGDIAHSFHNATTASSDGVIAGIAVHRALVFDKQPYTEIL